MRVSRQDVIRQIIFNLQQSGYTVTETVNVEDITETWRHACVYAGISFLPVRYIPVQTEGGIIQFPYYFCEACGKLYVSRFLYD